MSVEEGPRRVRRAAGRGAAAPRAWQRMLSGRRLDLLDPSPLDIEIRDIAHGLARVARWNGQTSGDHPYSVAQHSLLVEAIVPHLSPAAAAPERLAALLHDAPEYVVGDLISPFKAVIGAGYKAVEERLADAVRLRFRLPTDPRGSLKKLVKAADTVAAYHEAVALAGFTPDEGRRYFGAPTVATEVVAEFLTPWPTTEVERRFIARFEALDGGCA
jgi:5'-deoxynucleotidase YfbR-like HD superfamily hydrolase